MYKPIFNSNSYAASVNESVPLGTTIVQVAAEDDDFNQAGEVSFRFVADLFDQNSGSKLFSIDPNTGVIQTTDLLDREIKARHVLAVAAHDQGIQSQKSAVATVVIDVDDINDNSPVFNQALYIAEIYESAAAGSVVTVVSCSDLDSVDVGKLRFDISDSVDGMFVIDETGIIRTSRSIDYELSDNIQFLVICTDSIGHRVQALVVVNINPVNEHNPVFLNGTMHVVSILEDLNIGSYITEIQATDLDAGHHGHLLYNITNGNVGNHFAIEAISGKVWLRQSVDYEKLSHFNLTITAQDQGRRPQTAVAYLGVSIVDVNDNDPFFTSSLYISRLPEPVSSKVEVQKTLCGDRDLLDVDGLEVRLVDGDDNGYFMVTANGSVMTVHELDYEKKDSFVLTLLCTDRANHTAYATVIVWLVPHNEHTPVFINGSLYRLFVPEDTLPGTVLGTVNATDLDRGLQGLVRYTITDGDVGNVFGVDERKGRIWLQEQLDRETDAVYNLTVKASDGNRTAIAHVIIFVSDVNDNFPRFVPSFYSANVSENSTVGVTVMKVTCVDADELDEGKLKLKIIGGDLTDSFVVSNDGIIETTKIIDYEHQTSFALAIQCLDSVNQTARTVVAVQVVAANEHAPVFEKTHLSFSVEENAFVGEQIGSVKATDADKGRQGQLSYSITRGNSENKFSINAVTGQLWLQATLDREATDMYDLEVTVHDGSVDSKNATASVTVIVTDINDNVPQFINLLSSVPISEYSSIGQSILTVSVKDDDLGDNAKHTVAISGGNIGGTFVLNGNILQLAKTVDYESISRYSLTLTATETRPPFEKAVGIVTILVGNENDNKPIFHPSSYNIQLSERAQPGTVVTRLFATDSDGELNPIIFRILDGYGTFIVNSVTGVVSLTKQLNFRIKTYYEMTVTASDTKFEQSTLLTVFVLDDFVAPEFNMLQYTASIFTNGSYPKSVIRVSATDRDGDNVQYFIYKGHNPGFLHINNENGEISLLTIPPAHVLNYSLTIEAVDDSIQSLTAFATAFVFIIHVVETNDFDPEFDQQAYFANVSELAGLDTFIAIVHAVDRDDQNEVIRYSFSLSSATDLFVISPLTGDVTTAVSFKDTPLETQYNLVVIAVDEGIPQRSTEVVLTINVTTNNHHAPQFVSQDFKWTVDENSPIGKVISQQELAKDNDSGMDGVVEYSLHPIPGGESFASLFTINLKNGEFRVNGPIDYEKWIKGGDVIIVASDKGKVPKISTVIIHIAVMDINERPVFTFRYYASELYVNDKQIGKTLLTLNAIDPDIGELAGLVTYTKLSGTAESFVKINGPSVVLAETGTEVGRFFILVKAFDSGDPKLESEGTATVYIDVFSNEYLCSMTLEGATESDYKNNKKNILHTIARPFNGTAREQSYVRVSNRSGLIYFIKFDIFV